MAVELEEQPIPDVAVFCPECGAEPVLTPDETLAVEHRLSDAGYLHDDMALRCSNEACGKKWAHGVPVGSYELADADDLRCHSCRHDPDLAGEQYYRVHRVAIKRRPSPAEAGVVELHLKCPRCYHFAKATRDTDANGVALVGYPDITGAIEGAEPNYGYDPTVRLEDIDLTDGA